MRRQRWSAQRSTVRIFWTAGLLLVASCIRNPYEYKKPESITLVINEFLTSNTLGIFLDENGDREDFIELYNDGNESINVDGLYLSDDSTDLLQYRLPDTTVAPHGFLLVWADNDLDQGELHAPFKLSIQDGDEIILSVINGLIVDRIQFFPKNNNPESRLSDVSYGRESDGSNTWVRQREPSPGTANRGN